MALMPEDLLNKRFTPVRFSEGYDMDEVDNYLDNDVLPRLQELIDENERLTKELEEAHNRVAELESAGAASAPIDTDDADDAAAADETATEAPVEGTDAAAGEDATAAAAGAVSASDEVAPGTDATADAAVAEDQDTEDAAVPTADAGADSTASAAGIIALANRLHDEHVRAGETERDRLLSEANDEHARIIGEAEKTSRTTLEALETKKSELEKSIEGLRTFERDYRNRLRNYLEGQLRDLDTSDTQDEQANFGR